VTTDLIHALIIDDDRDTADLFSMVLGMVGFKCDVVYSAKSALATLATQTPQIILLDMRLGLEISGTDILYQIRSNPRLDETRVIVITAYPHLAAPIHDLADLVLLKPVEIEHLRTLATRLTQSQARPNSFREPLSNLYYYNFFLNRLEHAFERTHRRPDFMFVVMVIEPQIFRTDKHALLDEEHEQLMKGASEYLQAGFRPTDTFGRLDRERIVALYEDLKQLADVDTIIQRLRQGLTRSFEVGRRIFRISPLIGAALMHPNYSQPEELVQAAQAALDDARARPATGSSLAEPPIINLLESIDKK